MSEYSYGSRSSADSGFSNPPARNYSLPGFGGMTDAQSISESEKRTIIHALRTHRVNTLTELRRIERSFATIGTPDVSEPMTTAWAYYVNSHTLLTELRSLTRNYPFSSDCLDEAKRRVYADPSSNRSWNFCWLVLIKMQNDQLIPYYAQNQAAQPAMWGNYTPTADSIQQLADAFIAEWNYALEETLRHWEESPLAGRVE
ncbi:hypothetical protein P152DRAFT_419529 [Eremomyces bilateralis CBS 781.70]|uniref:Uncharacterized protein n=1 Tax=Eremomyces bilateralis CBS 781.70 TaxID=1392243 RepID=A0A6G1G051_9PEZI|nr:uncharacterized protein P152DRAFT_419529 [Eremomyces bilateralis CBS 781.70]KAF1811398.1 hypothetical protein P152DRAFT_419529 [Eremomyces bilateralis CBS 781.70]